LTKILRATLRKGSHAATNHGVPHPGTDQGFRRRFQLSGYGGAREAHHSRSNPAFARGGGDVPIVICALTVAEPGHGIYHTREEAKSRQRRRFLDELKLHVPIHPISGATAEIVARIGGEQAVKGITVPFADLVIGACALELEYAIATHNVRHFRLIPGLDVRQF